jgi:hypothetical protein
LVLISKKSGEAQSDFAQLARECATGALWLNGHTKKDYTLNKFYLMASAGQTEMHFLHPAHALGSITALFPNMLMAPTGQMLMHLPQPKHVSSLT